MSELEAFHGAIAGLDVSSLIASESPVIVPIDGNVAEAGSVRDLLALWRDRGGEPFSIVRRARGLAVQFAAGMLLVTGAQELAVAADGGADIRVERLASAELLVDARAPGKALVQLQDGDAMLLTWSGTEITSKLYVADPDFTFADADIESPLAEWLAELERTDPDLSDMIAELSQSRRGVSQLVGLGLLALHRPVDHADAVQALLAGDLPVGLDRELRWVRELPDSKRASLDRLLAGAFQQLHARLRDIEGAPDAPRAEERMLQIMRQRAALEAAYRLLVPCHSQQLSELARRNLDAFATDDGRTFGLPETAFSDPLLRRTLEQADAWWVP